MRRLPRKTKDSGGLSPKNISEADPLKACTKAFRDTVPARKSSPAV